MFSKFLFIAILVAAIFRHNSLAEYNEIEAEKVLKEHAADFKAHCGPNASAAVAACCNAVRNIMHPAGKQQVNEQEAEMQILQHCMVGKHDQNIEAMHEQITDQLRDCAPFKNEILKNIEELQKHCN